MTKLLRKCVQCHQDRIETLFSSVHVVICKVCLEQNRDEHGPYCCCGGCVPLYASSKFVSN